MRPSRSRCGNAKRQLVRRQAHSDRRRLARKRSSRFLWVNFAASLIACAISVWGWLSIDAFLRGDAAVEDLDAFDMANATIGFLEVAVFIVAAIAWLAWQSRTIDNEHALGIGPSPWSPARAIIWWFVPIANLFQPYRIHRDVYVRYHGAGVSVTIVQVWWALWLVSNILSNVAGRLWLTLETLEGLQTGLVVWVIADALSALLVLPAVALVRRIQRQADVRAVPSESLTQT